MHNKYAQMNKNIEKYPIVCQGTSILSTNPNKYYLLLFKHDSHDMGKCGHLANVNFFFKMLYVKKYYLVLMDYMYFKLKMADKYN